MSSQRCGTARPAHEQNISLAAPQSQTCSYPYGVWNSTYYNNILVQRFIVELLPLSYLTGSVTQTLETKGKLFVCFYVAKVLLIYIRI